MNRSLHGWVDCSDFSSNWCRRKWVKYQEDKVKSNTGENYIPTSNHLNKDLMIPLYLGTIGVELGKRDYSSATQEKSTINLFVQLQKGLALKSLAWQSHNMADIS